MNTRKRKPVIKDVSKWNDKMFKKHATPYTGIAGYVEKKRIQKILDYLNLKPSDRVLELGCEAGNFLVSLPPVKRLAALDVSREVLKAAKANTKKRGLKMTFKHGDLMKKIPFKQGEFTAIVCSETLEHLLDPKVAVKNIHALCDGKTRVVITVPNEKPKLIIKSILTKLGLMDKLMPGVEPGQSEWHLHAFSKEMLRDTLMDHFEIKRFGSVLGMHYVVELRRKRTYGRK